MMAKSFKASPSILSFPGCRPNPFHFIPSPVLGPGNPSHRVSFLETPVRRALQGLVSRLEFLNLIVYLEKSVGRI